MEGCALSPQWSEVRPLSEGEGSRGSAYSCNSDGDGPQGVGSQVQQWLAMSEAMRGVTSGGQRVSQSGEQHGADRVRCSGERGGQSRGKGESKRVTGVKRAMHAVADEGERGWAREVPTWAHIWDGATGRGRPEMKRVKAKMGAPPPERPEGMPMVDFVDEVLRDLKIMSRADATWKSYAMYQGLYEDWCVVFGVYTPWGDIKEVQRVVERSLVMMWLFGNYAAKTLQQYATAVSSRVREMKLGNLRETEDLRRLLEGISRQLGEATVKKAATLEEHVAWLLLQQVQVPQGGSRRWRNTSSTRQRLHKRKQKGDNDS